MTRTRGLEKALDGLGTHIEELERKQRYPGIFLVLFILFLLFLMAPYVIPAINDYFRFLIRLALVSWWTSAISAALVLGVIYSIVTLAAAAAELRPLRKRYDSLIKKEMELEEREWRELERKNQSGSTESR